MHQHLSRAAMAALTLILAGACERGGAEERLEPTPAEESAPAAAVAEAPAEPEAPDPAPGSAALGEAAPDFTLVDQAGARHTLSDHRGKIVVLEWTNPQCPYVQRHYQAETMKKLVAGFPEDRVVWFAIDSSHFIEPSDSAAWREAQGLDYPILQDPEGVVGRAYAARTTPHMFVIDAEGVLRYSGAIDDDVHGRAAAPTNHVEAAVGALLEGEAPPVAQTDPYGCSVKYQS